MDVRLGTGGSLPPAEHLLGELRGKVQIHHKVRGRKAQTAVFQIKEPVEIFPPLPGRQLRRLVDSVGGGVAVCDHHATLLIKSPPLLFVRGKAVHGEKHRGGIGIHISRLAAQRPVKIQVRRLGKGIAVPGKIDLPEGDTLPLETLAHHAGLGRLSGTVGPLQHDQLSAHFRFPFSCRTWTRNSGSFIIRPARRGAFKRR